MPISQIVTNSIANTAITAAKLASDAFTPQIFKPTITSPANNATDILDTQLITASPYLSLYGVAQANAQWEISTSPTFAFINVASTINGSNTQFQANASSGLVANTTVHYARVRYSDTSNNSSQYSDTIEFTTKSSFAAEIDVLLVAGGGGGGAVVSGGGGAGGLILASAVAITIATPYSVSIGGGGAGAVNPNSGTNGTNSTFSLGPYTSVGGGGGGADQGNPNAGKSGGSGGGCLRGDAGSGTPGQGNAGAAGIASPVEHGAGGGGGAGAAGTIGSLSGPTGIGGAGGNGLSSAILGSTYFWAGGGGGSAGIGGAAVCGNGGLGGGGGGGGQSPATQGTGGGSTAPSPSTGGFNGSAPGGGGAGGTNTGGGGGGGPHVSPSTAGSGGSGVLILKYPDTLTLTNPGGGLTISTTTSSPNKISRITAGTGNIQFN